MTCCEPVRSGLVTFDDAVIIAQARKTISELKKMLETVGISMTVTLKPLTKAKEEENMPTSRQRIDLVTGEVVSDPQIRPFADWLVERGETHEEISDALWELNGSPSWPDKDNSSHVF
jgi:hypothetical protein